MRSDKFMSDKMAARKGGSKSEFSGAPGAVAKAEKADKKQDAGIAKKFGAKVKGDK